MQYSASAAVKHEDNQKVILKDEIWMLFRNVEYLKLLFSFTIALGQLNGLAALINQLPGDYSSGEAGGLGAVLIMCGFMGAFCTGFLLNHSKAYKQVLQGSVIIYLFWFAYMHVEWMKLTDNTLFNIQIVLVINPLLVVFCIHVFQEQLRSFTS